MTLHAPTSDTVEIIRGVAIAQGIRDDLYHCRSWVHEEHVCHTGPMDTHENVSTKVGWGSIRVRLGYCGIYEQ